jgi:hypothetical protein
MSELFPPACGELIACIEREIRRRSRVYPNRVATRRMARAQAERELECMRAVLALVKEKAGATPSRTGAALEAKSPGRTPAPASESSSE